METVDRFECRLMQAIAVSVMIIAVSLPAAMMIERSMTYMAIIQYVFLFGTLFLWQLANFVRIKRKLAKSQPA